MTATKVVRPVWRRFIRRFLGRAAEYVRAGGNAAIVGLGADGEANRVDVLLPIDDAGKITDGGKWSLLAIDQERWRRVPLGVAKGLATARIHADYVAAVLDWCERDSGHPGPTRTMRLDCLECGCCCKDNSVVLYEDDLETWRQAGRPELLSKAFLQKKRDGRVLLRLAPTGRCQHLRRDLKCRIYPLRPFNCRVFPVGSEACLAARETTGGYRDE